MGLLWTEERMKEFEGFLLNLSMNFAISTLGTFSLRSYTHTFRVRIEKFPCCFECFCWWAEPFWACLSASRCKVASIARSLGDWSNFWWGRRGSRLKPSLLKIWGAGLRNWPGGLRRTRLQSLRHLTWGTSPSDALQFFLFAWYHINLWDRVLLLCILSYTKWVVVGEQCYLFLHCQLLRELKVSITSFS